MGSHTELTCGQERKEKGEIILNNNDDEKSESFCCRVVGHRMREKRMSISS